MTYRKLEYAGQTFQYVIGRSNTHIKFPGGGSYTASNENIGREVGDRKVMVTPSDVLRTIKGYWIPEEPENRVD